MGDTLKFTKPQSLISYLSGITSKHNVVIVEIVTTAKRREWKLSATNEQLNNKKYMRERMEVLNQFRREWPKGHSTVTVDGNTNRITVTLT